MRMSHEKFILHLGAFGTLDDMTDYDRVRSRIEIILFLIFKISYERPEKGVYNRLDVYGKNDKHKEGRICSLITYLVRLFSYKKKEGSTNIVEKVDKSITYLAKITGTLPGYDKTLFSCMRYKLLEP